MKSNLQLIRKEAGFRSARSFAEHMDMSPNTYTAFEQGRHSMNLEQAWAFADALGDALGRFVSLDELAGRKFPSAAVPPVDDREAELVRTWRGLDSERQGRLIGTAHDMEIAKRGGDSSTAVGVRGA